MASAPSPASPTTSWPPPTSTSLTILRMNAASSTTRTRAMSHLRLLCWGFGQSVPLIGSRRPVLEPEHLVDRELEAAVLGDEQPARGAAHAVDVEVDRVVDLVVELDHRARGQGERAARGHARAAELGPHADRDGAQRVAHGRAARVLASL